MSGETWAIFDTETTGLIANDLRPLERQPRVIEIAGVLIRRGDDGGWSEIGCIDTLIDPGCRIDPIISKVTGIQPRDLVGKPRWADIAQEVADFFGKADVVAAHNLSFDMRIVSMEDRRIGKVTLWPDHRVCSVEACESIFGKRVKLGDLHAHLFGAAHENAHRALDDVRANARCIVELHRRGEIA